MDALRQWWHDIAAPKVHKARWFLAFWVVLALVAIPWGVRAEERSLEEASVAALADAGVTVEDITFTGRNAVISGELTQKDRVRAENVLGGVDGIRTIEWRVEQVTPPPVTYPPPATTTTTTLPPGDAATLTVKVNLGKLSLRGVMPDAHRVAWLGTLAQRTYGADASNRLSVGDVVEPSWLDTADRFVAGFGVVSGADVALDSEGITGNAVVPTEGAAEVFEAMLEDMRSDVFSVDVEVTVSEGETATVSIVDDGDVVTLAGALPRRTWIDALEELVAAVDGGEVVSSVELDKSLAQAFALTRLDELVALLGTGELWSLTYEDEHLSGERVGGGLFRADPDRPPTAAGSRFLAEVAGMMIGDPRLELAIEVGSAVRDDGSTDLEMAAKRAGAIADALMRMGVDPDRMTVVGIDDGEVLRFSLEPAER